MKSPFPGMDPYLERYWLDVHHGLCTYARDQLQPQVRPALFARIAERVVIESPEDDRSINPDIKIVELPWSRGNTGTTAMVETDQPLRVQLEIEPYNEGFIQIFDSSTGKLVTVIEFLSLSNKLPGEGREKYRQKQRELAEAVSLVEVDLLRTGKWIVQAPQGNVLPRYRMSYRVCVRRGWDNHNCEYYPIPLDQPLPKIKVPLRHDDPDAVLDLPLVLNQVYVNGAYDTIDYRSSPEPPLEGAAAEWAQKLLANTLGK